MSRPSKKRITWEEDVIYQIEILGDTTTSDAQAIIEANDQLLQESYKEARSPLETAELFLKPDDQGNSATSKANFSELSLFDFAE